MRSVHVIPTWSDTEFGQGFYLDRTTQTLFPNRTFVDEHGNVLFETNSLGLRGSEPAPGQRIAVVWGDSVVFSLMGTGWPEQINDPSLDCLFLNGGIEGSSYARTLTRALHFNRRHRAVLNVLLLGWFPLGANNLLADDLRDALAELPNAVIMTQPTSLNPSIADTDLSDFIRRTDDDEAFGFFGSEPYSLRGQRALFAHLCERNAIIRDVARSTGTPLIDLCALMDSSTLDDFRRDFFDFSHLRSSAYPRIAAITRDSVRPFLEALTPSELRG